ncbi:MAG: alkaline phosphatase family protein [Microbacteriaceae bacterium]|nr:alkaline phosphatase family protein [Microbacteriaceae bacterium]
MLPSAPPQALSLAGVLGNVTSRLGSGSGLVCLIDGLGAEQLREFKAYARNLNSVWDDSAISSVAPSTTAVAITTASVGKLPGAHGLLGYTMYDPDSDSVRSVLSEVSPKDALKWQKEQTIFEKTGNSYVIAPAALAGSGFTVMALRGAEYVGIDDPLARVEKALELLRKKGNLVYLYFSEVDKAAHASGVGSEPYLKALELVDSTLGDLFAKRPEYATIVITADHGQLNVPRDNHVIIPDEWLKTFGVKAVAGEPRTLQFVLEAGSDPEPLVSALKDKYGDFALVYKVEDLVAAGWWKNLSDDIRSRCGQVFISPVGNYAFYTHEHDPARGMIGQHGSFDSAEMSIPLIRL